MALPMPLNLNLGASSGASSGGITITPPTFTTPAWLKVGQGVPASIAAGSVAGVPDIWLIAIAGLGLVWYVHRGGKL